MNEKDILSKNDEKKNMTICLTNLKRFMKLHQISFQKSLRKTSKELKLEFHHQTF